MKKSSLFITAMVVIFLAGSNIYLFMNKTEFSYTGISGRLVEETPKLPLNLNISIIAFVAQWIILLIIVFISYARFIKHKQDEHIKINYNEIKKKQTRSRTDLDILYEILKEKKRLRIVTIARVFKINREKALEWAKILENQELVIIEYPTFSEPEVIINEKENKEIKKEGKEKKKGKEEENKKDTKRKTRDKRIKGKKPLKKSKKRK